MDDVPESREIAASAVEEMVGLAEIGGTVRHVRPADRGFCSVYEVVLDGERGPERLYLKASPDGGRWGIPVEARLQAVLAAQTSIPVPGVRCVADDHERLPTPFYLMDGLPGTELPYEEVCYLADDTLKRLASETGRYLAELHAVPAVEQFGHVRHDGETLTGQRPAGDPAVLTTEESSENWPPYLRSRVDQALERHADSQFSDLTAELREWFETEIPELEGPFEPVLGRNDHGLHNLLVDPESGEITGMLDWGYTLAVPAALDLEFAVYITSGAFLSGLPAVSDRRGLVREAMLRGYRAEASDPELVDRVSTPEPLYEGLAIVRLMNDFELLEYDADETDSVRAALRSHARAVVDKSLGRKGVS